MKCHLGFKGVISTAPLILHYAIFALVKFCSFSFEHFPLILISSYSDKSVSQ